MIRLINDQVVEAEGLQLHWWGYALDDLIWKEPF